MSSPLVYVLIGFSQPSIVKTDWKHCDCFYSCRGVKGMVKPCLRDLLSAVHHFSRSFNGFNVIHGVFQVNVLPVLTVCHPVTPALPVSSDPGVKHRRSHDTPLPPYWHALQRVGTGGELTSTSHQTSRGFMNPPTHHHHHQPPLPPHWIAFQINSVWWET